MSEDDAQSLHRGSGGSTGAHVASLDLAACSRQGVVVCNTAGGGPGAPFATAELALGLLIAAARARPPTRACGPAAFSAVYPWG